MVRAFIGCADGIRLNHDIYCESKSYGYEWIKKFWGDEWFSCWSNYCSSFVPGWEAIEKAAKVFISCETKEQLEVARKYGRLAIKYIEKFEDLWEEDVWEFRSLFNYLYKEHPCLK